MILKIREQLSIKKNINEVYFELIKDEINVKEIIINESQNEDVILDITITEELRKEGDIRKLIRAVQDMRKEKGMSPQDNISLFISSVKELGDISLLKSTCKIIEIKEDKNIEGQSVELSTSSVVISI